MMTPLNTVILNILSASKVHISNSGQDAPALGQKGCMAIFSYFAPDSQPLTVTKLFFEVKLPISVETSSPKYKCIQTLRSQVLDYVKYYRDCMRIQRLYEVTDVVRDNRDCRDYRDNLRD